MSYGVAGVGAGNCAPYPVAGAYNKGCCGIGSGIGFILVLFILLVIITRAVWV